MRKNIEFFSIAPSKVIVLDLPCYIFCIISFHYRSFSLLKAIAISFSLLFAITFKIEKEQQLSLFMESNTEKKLWINVQNRCKIWSKVIKSDNFCYRKVRWEAIERESQYVIKKNLLLVPKIINFLGALILFVSTVWVGGLWNTIIVCNLG